MREMDDLIAERDQLEKYLGDANDKIEQMVNAFGLVWETARKWA